jgi:lipopolysaccharide transport system ATP-binding protein
VSADVLIQVEHVSKKFCRSLNRALRYGVRDIGNELLGRNGHHDQLRPAEFWALDDVSFAVRRGECLGLIGPNGAGKSTLLKMLNGLIKPDRGRIAIRGRLGALIALGAGFNPVLTGRENIYNNAAVLGLSKREVDQKLDAIIDFAELDAHAIDAPLQTYSSGMHVRLGFAIAAMLVEPDVLLLDEVLAVGDIGFVIKCLNAIRGIAQNSATVFVSHSMQLVSSFCSRVAVLRHGSLLMAGPPMEGIDCYLAQFPVQSNLSGTGQAIIDEVSPLATVREGPDQEVLLQQGDRFECALSISITSAFRGVARVVVYIMDEAMAPIVCCPVQSPNSTELLLTAGRHNFVLPLGRVDLNAGKYCLTVIVSSVPDGTCLARLQGAIHFRVAADHTYWGRVVRPLCAGTYPVGLSS